MSIATKAEPRESETMPHDALIIGGSYAGLSAAMQLVRARRRVLVIDDGRPRNRFAARAHGVLTNDGKPGAEFTWDGNDEMDPAQGRGWAALNGDEIEGRIYFHQGDDSPFKAKKTGIKT